MRKLSTVLFLFVAMIFVYCTASKKVQAPAKTTYQADIHPIITGTCSPCHVGSTAKQKLLDNYTAAKLEADVMITRISKNPGERGFMPMKHPKLPDTTIAKFVKWKNDGLLEK